MICPAALDCFQTLIAANTMFNMHDQLARLQRGDFPQKILCPPPSGSGTRNAGPENILF